jgi:hypothetical protein
MDGPVLVDSLFSKALSFETGVECWKFVAGNVVMFIDFLGKLIVLILHVFF